MERLLISVDIGTKRIFCAIFKKGKFEINRFFLIQYNSAFGFEKKSMHERNFYMIGERRKRKFLAMSFEFIWVRPGKTGFARSRSLRAHVSHPRNSTCWFFWFFAWCAWFLPVQNL